MMSLSYPRLTLPLRFVPFIIQTARSPVDLFCQKIFGVAYSGGIPTNFQALD